MNTTIYKKIALVSIVAVVVVAIWYLNVHKPVHIDPNSSADVTTTPITTQPVISESGATSTSTATSLSTKTATTDRTQVLAAKAAKYSKAKELAGPQGFINSAPFKLSDYVGKKVILLDFWTYSCINCQRTLPYVTSWYKKYEDKGLLIVGIHTPEFDFEKNYDNVTAATKKAGVTYPVVLDSNYGTWNAYGNEYWPREYLIDIDGYVVHDNIGEGKYDETEKAIQHALVERDAVLGLKNDVPMTMTVPSDVVVSNESKVQSPETYFGARRNDYLANGMAGRTGAQSLAIPSTVSANRLYLGGDWLFTSEFAESAGSTNTITYMYNAKNVYFVASAAKGSVNGVKLKITRDGQLLGADAGADVSSDGTVTIKENRLYSLVKGSDYGSHTLQIEVEGSGLDAYTFTFG